MGSILVPPYSWNAPVNFGLYLHSQKVRKDKPPAIART